MNSEPIIETHNLSKRFRIGTGERMTLFSAVRHRFGGEPKRDLWALKDINISINRGEMVAVLGLNGAGKSTLLRVLAGIMRPTSGTCTVNDEVSCLFDLGLGFNPRFTALENIYLYGALHGLSRKDVDKILPDIVDFSELANFLGATLNEFSSGMKTRLAFATVIQAIHGIVMVDEVLSVGDVSFQKKCLNAFEKMLNSGTTILFVSHGLSDTIRRLCSKAIYLEKGNQAAFGPFGEVEKVFSERVAVLSKNNTL